MKTNVYFIAMFDDLVIYDNLDSSCYCHCLYYLALVFTLKIAFQWVVLDSETLLDCQLHFKRQKVNNYTVYYTNIV